MKGTMLAARAYPGEGALRLEEVPIPSLRPGDALVRVAATGLGPGPITWWQHGMTRPLPVIPGHEIAGWVAEVSDGVGGVRQGDRVRVHANLTCRDCVFCRTDREPYCLQASILGGLVFDPEGVELNAPYHDGGLADYVKVPAWLLDPIPAAVPLEVAARMHDLGVAARALKLASMEPGAAVVILAATGGMGVGTIRLAPLYGVGRVVAVGRSRERLERVKALAPTLVEVVALEELGEEDVRGGGLARAIRALTPGGAAAIIDYLGHAGIAAAAAGAARNGATMVVIGAGREPLPLPTAMLMKSGLRVMGSRSCVRRDAQELLRLAGLGQLQVADLISHRIPLAEVNEAVQELRTRRSGAWLITIQVAEEAAERAPSAAPSEVRV